MKCIKCGSHTFEIKPVTYDLDKTIEIPVYKCTNCPAAVMDEEQMHQLQTSIMKKRKEDLRTAALNKKKKHTYKFGKDFSSMGGALTLNPEEVQDGERRIGEFSKTHPDGWTIRGLVKVDYYYYVNDFYASHPKFGDVFGNFEKEVWAEKKTGFKDFFKKHKPLDWDYNDI